LGKEDCHEVLIWGQVIMGLVVILEDEEEDHEDHSRMFSGF
jgi:hypothetical protein